MLQNVTWLILPCYCCKPLLSCHATREILLNCEYLTHCLFWTAALFWLFFPASFRLSSSTHFERPCCQIAEWVSIGIVYRFLTFFLEIISAVRSLQLIIWPSESLMTTFFTSTTPRFCSCSLSVPLSFCLSLKLFTSWTLPPSPHPAATGPEACRHVSVTCIPVSWWCVFAIVSTEELTAREEPD